MLLLHCEQDLEDCFDETGLDDVFFTIHEEVIHSTITPNCCSDLYLATQLKTIACSMHIKALIPANLGGQSDEHQGAAGPQHAQQPRYDGWPSVIVEPHAVVVVIR